MNEKNNIEEKILSEERVYEGKIVKVSILDVTLPNGEPAKREALRHVGASAIVPVDDEGNVTLVRQYRAPIASVLLEIPAGKLDFKGENRLEAARRELREETGIVAGKLTRLSDIVPSPGYLTERITLYLAQELSQGDTDPDDDEFLNVEKIPLTELVARVMRGEIEDAKTITAVLKTKLLLEAER